MEIGRPEGGRRSSLAGEGACINTQVGDFTFSSIALHLILGGRAGGSDSIVKSDGRRKEMKAAFRSEGGRWSLSFFHDHRHLCTLHFRGSDPYPPLDHRIQNRYLDTVRHCAYLQMGDRRKETSATFRPVTLLALSIGPDRRREAAGSSRSSTITGTSAPSIAAAPVPSPR